MSFDVEERQRLRSRLIEVAKNDPRITGIATTGSASVGSEDRWSDIDLAFGVDCGVEEVLSDFSAWMYRSCVVVDHLDVPSGSWVYRVFLLANTLQVDLAFAPTQDFGAKAPTFQLVHGESVELPHAPLPQASRLIGWAWLYALHVRSAIARGRFWQAEYMISGMRDQVIALACLRHGLPAGEGRGVDLLPPEILEIIEPALVRSLDTEELRRAFAAVTHALLNEVEAVDRELSERLRPVLSKMLG